MAGSEGSVGGQTELLSGWSCVVHRPSEDPEPSSLPSTVDITAFSSGPSVPPTHNPQNECCSNSDSDSGSDSENSVSDASGSCSYSSSDSESSSSSQASSSSSVPPQFSVTSSQTGGLRLTIATVRKSCSSPGPQNEQETLPSTVATVEAEKNISAPKLSSSDSDSDCSDSESTNSESQSQKSLNSDKKIGKRDSPGGRVKYLRKVNTKTMNKHNDKVDSGKKFVRKEQNSKVAKTSNTRGRGRLPVRGNKMASLPLARISSPAGDASSSDESSVSESNSAMLASCSLQEIRQEDLAAILPDQQEPDCDAFGGFETGVHNVQDVDDASGSDMELPTQLVHAAIQRVTTGTESSSETDSQPATYASTLLQQFVQQTQLLNNPSGQQVSSTEADSKSTNTTQDTVKTSDGSKSDAIKRKRGRPRKNPSKKSTNNSTILPDCHNNNNLLNNEYCGEPNVSPDSGIQNSPDHLSSPESSPSQNVKSKNESNTSDITKNKTNVKKVNQKIAQKQKMALTCNNLDRMLYANADRVLYPPRRKAGRPVGKIGLRKPGRPPKHRHEIAQNVNNSEKSAAEPEKKVHTSKSSQKNKKSNKTSDNDIVQLTSNTLCLSLGKSDHKKSDISNTNVNTVPKKTKSSGALLSEICERVSKRLELSNKCANKSVLQSTASDENTTNSKNSKNCQKPKCIAYIKNKTKLSILKSKLTSFKHMKVMHTKHYQKHKKHKIKILKTVTSQSALPTKIDPDIDKLISDFVKYCNLGTNKPQKENLPEMFRCVKRLSKKRKGLENSDGRKKKKQTNTNSGESKETNEQRLPLKKRHYHISANNAAIELDSSKESVDTKTKNGVINSNKTVSPEKAKNPETQCAPNKSPSQNLNKSVLVMNKNNDEAKVANNNNLEKNSENLIDAHIDEAIEACITRYTAIKPPEAEKLSTPEPKKSVTTITATTPKKRHRLEVENIDTNVQLDVTKKLDSTLVKTNDPVETNVLEKISIKKPEKKIETVAQMITRKKNRLEDLASNLVSKKSNINSSETTDKKSKNCEAIPEQITRASVIKSPIVKKIKPPESDKLLDSIVDEKPTGIFLQTVDLELHIPATTIQTVQHLGETKHNLRNKKVPEIIETEKPDKKTTKEVEKPETSDNKLKKKVRRRKAINRTGFPTVKKKKKKKVEVPKIVKPEVEVKDNNIYDRVPRIGEEASTFVKRTQTNGTLSVVALEKLQAKPENNISSTESDIVSKWEISSECDSLPMDECTFTSEFEPTKSVKSERCSSRLEIKQERMSLRLRDISPATSVETRSSDRVKKRRDLTPDTKSLEERIHYRTRDSSAGSELTLHEELERSLKRKRDFSSDKMEKRRKMFDESQSYFRKRIRDLSPASSIEPLPSDKKQRSDSVASSSGDDTKRSKKANKWRKKFLVAGLFSDYYKEDDESARARRESASTKNRLVYNPNEHPYGLLPSPYHCGKYLRCRKVPFQLPHDLWWQHTHSQLPGRDLVPSWNYRKIRTNVYCARFPSGACEPQACNCSTSSSCEDDCINRLVLAECPSTHRCGNQKIQKHEWAPGLEKFMTENKGWGVRTKMSIKSGEFILEYVGEVVSDQEFKHRMATRYAHDTHHYCLHLDGGLVIDGHRMGGDGRFVNHSCQPNCEMQKWSVNGQFRMALFALRDISPDEELTYDYNFSLFNPAEGQVCKCGSNNCRGVIGGKSQRVRQLPSTVQSNSEVNSNQVGRVGRPRKNQAKKATSNGVKEQPKEEKKGEPIPVIVTPQVKPMSHQQKIFALQHHCFLLRNLEKVKRIRERMVSIPRAQSVSTAPSSFLNQLNALRKPRNMRTRRLAQAEDNPELNKAARLATVLRDLFELVTTAKDEHNEFLCTPFLTLPSKRKVPEYFQKISEPIDLNTIEQNIATGVYRTVDAFDSDMIKLFVNSVKYFGRTSELGIAATRLRKVYGQGKADCLKRLEDVLGEKAPPNFVTGGKDPGDEEEDVIRCICGLYRDEGLMIQCERCLVWQHCECVRADPSTPTYHCERCVPRPVDLEIPLEEFTEHGHRYYISLMRGDLQLRQGDTVYVLRDIPIPGTDKKHTYETVGNIKYTDLDIFRIERLWKNKDNGERFAFGHHYLRPHETYHEPTRKFFPNEVMRVPLYEVVPVELIMSVCWVLDINTYCKGRPIDSSEEHIYICEYRVDKTARLFSKISKSKYPLCTKSYAFERFDQRLKISRTFTPHDVQAVVKPRGRRPGEEKEDRKEDVQQATALPVPVIRVRTREEQKAHLNGILLRLLGRLPSKQTLDLSYLLEGGRRRKKQQS